MSTPLVLPPIQEQAGQWDIEMATEGPEMEVLEEVELLFGKPSRELTPAEKAKYWQYEAEWDEQDQLEHEQQERIAHTSEEHNAKWQAKQDEQKQKWEKAAHTTEEYDAHLQVQKKAETKRNSSIICCSRTKRLERQLARWTLSMSRL